MLHIKQKTSTKVLVFLVPENPGWPEYSKELKKGHWDNGRFSICSSGAVRPGKTTPICSTSSRKPVRKCWFFLVPENPGWPEYSKELKKGHWDNGRFSICSSGAVRPGKTTPICSTSSRKPVRKCWFFYIFNSEPKN